MGRSSLVVSPQIILEPRRAGAPHKPQRGPVAISPGRINEKRTPLAFTHRSLIRRVASFFQATISVVNWRGAPALVLFQGRASCAAYAYASFIKYFFDEKKQQLFVGFDPVFSGWLKNHQVPAGHDEFRLPSADYAARKHEIINPAIDKLVQNIMAELQALLPDAEIKEITRDCVRKKRLGQDYQDRYAIIPSVRGFLTIISIALPPIVKKPA